MFCAAKVRTWLLCCFVGFVLAVMSDQVDVVRRCEGCRDQVVAYRAFDASGEALSHDDGVAADDLISRSLLRETWLASFPFCKQECRIEHTQTHTHKKSVQCVDSSAHLYNTHFFHNQRGCTSLAACFPSLSPPPSSSFPPSRN